ncbi:transmembrane protein 183A isoform X2 [Ambystoma mexicanum]|uniref:transmembrane protein 183A isoform X2 n=1 Tax=Ambystoma mexicanum TaxID=8296 RepID=UPI0037E980E1
MRKKRRGKRLKERGEELNTAQVTVADFANSDPAVVKSGRVRKAVANAIKKEVKSLCGLEASLVPVDDELTFCTVNEQCESSDDLDMAENSQEIVPSGKKKRSRRHKAPEDKNGGDYPIDIWLMLASYIRPEDIVKFALICKNAWTVTCTAAFWMRLYRRHYHMDANLPVRLRPECIEKLRSLRACVIRSLYHMYEPFTSRLSKNPTIPESTPSNLANSKCMLFWCRRTVGNRQETMWEFNFKFQKQFTRFKNSHHVLRPPTRYEEVHNNPDEDCCLLQVTTLNFIFIPIVMGMTLSCDKGIHQPGFWLQILKSSCCNSSSVLRYSVGWGIYLP